MPKSALIIEDDADIAESVRYNLESEGFAAVVASTGEQRVGARSQSPTHRCHRSGSLLPGMSGMELWPSPAQKIKLTASHHMLTAKTSEADRIAGLDLGADDYIAKPFSVRELMARVRAVLRRADDEAGERYDDGQLAIDFANVLATCDGAPVKLTNKNSGCWSRWLKSVPVITANNCSTRCGAILITAMPARWTFIFGAETETGRLW